MTNLIFSSFISVNNNAVNVFAERQSWRTLAIDVKNKRFWVPRGTMAAYSAVFRAMLFGKSGEINGNIVYLTEKKADDIYQLLLCLTNNPMRKSIDFSKTFN